MTTPSGASVVISRVTAITPYGYFIQWEVKKPSPTAEYRFWVDRSGSSEGPWEEILADAPDKYCTLDRFDRPADTAPGSRRPNQLALTRQFYYRVRMLSSIGERDEAIHDNDPPLDRKTSQHYRRALANFQAMLRLKGQPCAVLKRKGWGKRCPKCTDSVLREGVKSACTICWGTGFEGGFWNPVLVQAYRADGTGTSVNTPEQRSDTKVSRVQLPNVPDVERGDVLIFPRDRRRFLIEGFGTPELIQNDTHQSCTATELSPGHILYRFKFVDDPLSALV